MTLLVALLYLVMIAGSGVLGGKITITLIEGRFYCPEANYAILAGAISFIILVLLAEAGVNVTW